MIFYNHKGCLLGKSAQLCRNLSRCYPILIVVVYAPLQLPLNFLFVYVCVLWPIAASVVPVCLLLCGRCRLSPPLLLFLFVVLFTSSLFEGCSEHYLLYTSALGFFPRPTPSHIYAAFLIWATTFYLIHTLGCCQQRRGASHIASKDHCHII